MFNIKSNSLNNVIIIIIFPLSGCSVGDTVFRYYNAKANDSISKNYFKEGKENYQKAQGFSRELGYIAQNNQTLTNHQDNQLEISQKNFQKIIEQNCIENQKKYCNQIYYNQGNNYYRLGETEENLETQKKLWTKSIESYKKTLELNKDDKEAQENLKFVESKLQQAKEQQSDSQSNQSQDGDKGNDKNKGNREQQEQEKKLSQEMNQKVEEYLKQMESQEKNLQKYFQQKPKETNNQNEPFNNFFNDHFFNNFFQNQNINFNNQGSSNEKDW